MSSEKTTKVKNIKVDVVVIGSGASGMAAAVSAAEGGAAGVLVLEKLSEPGGNSAKAGGIFACESPAQKRENIVTNKDDYFKIFTRWAHWKRINPRIVRAFINKSGDSIKWLEEKGIDFMLVPGYPGQVRVGHIPSGGGGAHLIRVLIEKGKGLGVSVTMDTSAKKLIRGPQGITGLVAVNEKGEELQIKTKAVIIASGGIAGNVELLKKYSLIYYEGMRVHGTPHTGDGLLMAAEVGAAIAGEIPLLKEGPSVDIPEVNIMIMESMREPYTVWVNKNGQRFIDEAAKYLISETGNAIIQQPGRVMFALFDDKLRQSMEAKSFRIVRKREENKPQPSLPAGGPGGKTEYLDELKRMAKQGVVKIANSWDEIAEWIGAKPAVLKATIAEYNDSCGRKYDALFVKDPQHLQPLLNPPFYGIRGVTSMLDTLGGIKTNEHMEVLDEKANVIPGLYAAGVCVDGFEPDTYCSELTGSSMGFSLNSGRIAGENATKYALGK